MEIQIAETQTEIETQNKVPVLFDYRLEEIKRIVALLQMEEGEQRRIREAKIRRKNKKSRKTKEDQMIKKTFYYNVLDFTPESIQFQIRIKIQDKTSNIDGLIDPHSVKQKFQSNQNVYFDDETFPEHLIFDT